MKKKFPPDKWFDFESKDLEKELIKNIEISHNVKNRYKYYDNIISSLRNLLMSEFITNINESLLRDVIEILVDFYIETLKLKVDLKEKLRTIISARANITVKRSDLSSTNPYSTLINDYVFALEITNKFLASEQEMIETTFNLVWKQTIKLEEIIRSIFGFADMMMNKKDLIQFINFIFEKFRKINSITQDHSIFLKLLPLNLIDKIVYNGVSFEYHDRLNHQQA